MHNKINQPGAQATGNARMVGGAYSFLNYIGRGNEREMKIDVPPAERTLNVVLLTFPPQA